MSLSKSLFKIVGKMLARKNLVLAGSLFYHHNKKTLGNDVIIDYIRSATLELVADEIADKQLKGSVAEVGVFKGEFASRLNNTFKNHTLYLFDTFEGFDERDAIKEKQEAFSTATQNFADTSVDFVLRKMVDRTKCVVRKGYFPETTNGIEDKFIFVSLDADLYDPILAGLNFFYPRLVSGGYIFIHDYNNMEYKGARKAVKDFCKTHCISFTPLPDVGGTAVITR